MTSIETLRAVHHPTRRRILEFLQVEGPSQVTAMARGLGEQVGSISHHLRMLEGVGLVERAPHLATDGRTSWWRYVDTKITWSVDDFAGQPADRIQAQTAEKLNIEYQFRKLSSWKRGSDRDSTQWRQAAFSSDGTTVASAGELTDLRERLATTIQEWRDSIDSSDGDERRPVFVFIHGFPTRP